jgi:tetratricopeptide (TPR) repeat protein
MFETSEDFARSVKSARKALGLSLEDASRGICSAGYLSLIERGLRVPSVKIQALLVDLLGLDSDSTRAQELPPLVVNQVELAIRLGNFEEVLGIVEQIADPSIRALSNGLLNYAQGDLVQAIIQFDRSLEENVAPTWLRLKAGLGLTKALRDSGRFSRALTTGEQTLFLAAHDGRGALLESEVYELRAVLSGACVEIGELERARDLVAIAETSEISDLWEQVTKLWSISIIETTAGNQELAFDAAKKALKLVDSAERPVARARLLNLAAAIELRMLDPDLERVEDLIHEAVRVFSFLDLKVDLAASLSTQGDLYSFRNDAAESTRLYSESISLLNSSDHEMIGRIHASAATSFYRLGEISSAQHHLLIARNMLESNGASRTAAMVWRQMASIYEGLGDTTSALECFRAATELLGVHGFSVHVSSNEGRD